MMYPFLTLEDDTEIVHSEMNPDGQVKVYVEKPDEKDCFHHMTCYLPDYRIEDVYGFDIDQVNNYLKLIQDMAHLIMEFSQTGGFDNASGL